MSNFAMRHPGDDLLLRYIDGELPGRKARQIGKHLQACWQCRLEIDELQATAADCVRYRQQVLAANLPEPPQPWAGLSLQFDRIDDSLAARPLWERLLPRQAMGWGLAAAAAIALLCGVYFELRQTPSVQAAALLQRAVNAATRHPQPRHALRIRTRQRQIVRAAFDTSMPPSVAARLTTAHYDSADPLSARAFEAWRESLAQKSDEIASGRESYRIHTVAAAGELASATLTLRTGDLHPVAEMLEFRDQDFIEFTEITEPPAVGGGASAATNAEVPVRSSVPSGTAAFAPSETASISDELQVLSALHQIGADLGDPVEISRSGGRVAVGGVGVPAARQQQIHRMLDGLPRVSVNFANPPAVPSGVPAISDGAAVSGASREAAAPRAQARLEQQLGGRTEFDRFSAQVLDWNETAMARVYALRALAQRFPQTAEEGLTPRDREELRAMAREHAASYAAQFIAIGRVLDPALEALGAPRPAAPASTGTAWQGAAEDLFRASRRVEVLLSLLLGVAPGQPSSAEVPAQLASAEAQARAALDNCQRLLGK